MTKSEQLALLTTSLQNLLREQDRIMSKYNLGYGEFMDIAWAVPDNQHEQYKLKKEQLDDFKNFMADIADHKRQEDSILHQFSSREELRYLVGESNT